MNISESLFLLERVNKRNTNITPNLSKNNIFEEQPYKIHTQIEISPHLNNAGKRKMLKVRKLNENYLTNKQTDINRNNNSFFPCSPTFVRRYQKPKLLTEQAEITSYSKRTKNYGKPINQERNKVFLKTSTSSNNLGTNKSYMLKYRNKPIDNGNVVSFVIDKHFVTNLCDKTRNSNKVQENKTGQTTPNNKIFSGNFSRNYASAIKRNPEFFYEINSSQQKRSFFPIQSGGKKIFNPNKIKTEGANVNLNIKNFSHLLDYMSDGEDQRSSKGINKSINLPKKPVDVNKDIIKIQSCFRGHLQRRKSFTKMKPYYQTILFTSKLKNFIKKKININELYKNFEKKIKPEFSSPNHKPVFYVKKKNNMPAPYFIKKRSVEEKEIKEDYSAVGHKNKTFVPPTVYRNKQNKVTNNSNNFTKNKYKYNNDNKINNPNRESNININNKIDLVSKISKDSQSIDKNSYQDNIDISPLSPILPENRNQFSDKDILSDKPSPSGGYISNKNKKKTDNNNNTNSNSILSSEINSNNSNKNIQKKSSWKNKRSNIYKNLIILCFKIIKYVKIRNYLIYKNILFKALNQKIDKVLTAKRKQKLLKLIAKKSKKIMHHYFSKYKDKIITERIREIVLNQNKNKINQIKIQTNNQINIIKKTSKEIRSKWKENKVYNDPKKNILQKVIIKQDNNKKIKKCFKLWKKRSKHSENKKYIKLRIKNKNKKNLSGYLSYDKIDLSNSSNSKSISKKMKVQKVKVGHSIDKAKTSRLLPQKSGNSIIIEKYKPSINNLKMTNKTKMNNKEMSRNTELKIVNPDQYFKEKVEKIMRNDDYIKNFDTDIVNNNDNDGTIKDELHK